MSPAPQPIVPKGPTTSKRSSSSSAQTYALIAHYPHEPPILPAGPLIPLPPGTPLIPLAPGALPPPNAVPLTAMSPGWQGMGMMLPMVPPKVNVSPPKLAPAREVDPTPLQEFSRPKPPPPPPQPTDPLAKATDSTTQPTDPTTSEPDNADPDKGSEEPSEKQKRTPSHPPTQRAFIVGLSALHYTASQISTLTSVPQRSIRNIIERAKARGFDPDTRPIVIKKEWCEDGTRTGRPKKEDWASTSRGQAEVRRRKAEQEGRKVLRKQREEAKRQQRAKQRAGGDRTGKESEV